MIANAIGAAIHANKKSDSDEIGISLAAFIAASADPNKRLRSQIRSMIREIASTRLMLTAAGVASKAYR
jgi:hypothetical protein